MTNWFYYNDKGEKIGPVSAIKLKELVKNGMIRRETMIEDDKKRLGLAGELQGLDFPERINTLDASIPASVPEQTPFNPQFVPRVYRNIDRGILILANLVAIATAVAIVISMIPIGIGCFMMMSFDFIAGFLVCISAIPGLVLACLFETVAWQWVIVFRMAAQRD